LRYLQTKILGDFDCSAHRVHRHFHLDMLA
jgi:hypothetical protein